MLDKFLIFVEQFLRSEMGCEAHGCSTDGNRTAETMNFQQELEELGGTWINSTIMFV